MDGNHVESVPDSVQWSWVDFAMGEDIRTEARLLQDQNWSSAVSDGRSHVSHREYSSIHSRQFVNAINYYKTVKFLLLGYASPTVILSKLTIELMTFIIELALPGQGPLVILGNLIGDADKAESILSTTAVSCERGEDNKSHHGNSFRISARCRPLLDYEKDLGAYNTIDTLPSSSEIVVHDGKLARGGRWLTMSHKTFLLDKVYRMDASNMDVCSTEVKPLLTRFRQGQSSSLICFGQTGTGKTYTLLAVLKYVLENLIDSSIEIIFYEIHGKHCYDLLNDRKVVHLRSDEKEVVHVRGARSIKYFSSSSSIGDFNHQRTVLKESSSSAEESTFSSDTSDIFDHKTLMDIVRGAIDIRSSTVTERNPTSSRSHAVCEIRLISSPILHASTAAASVSNESTLLIHNGKLTLVDLAGSERNYDTTKMTAVQHRESSEINFSLMALKDCFRAQFTQFQESSALLKIRAPTGISITQQSPYETGPIKAIYRASPLTRVLKECFTNSSSEDSSHKCHYSAIITTLSPSPADVQHSLNSLEHVILMNPFLQARVHNITLEIPLLDDFLSDTPISAWTPEQVRFWLSTTNNGRFEQLSLPPGLDGKGLMTLNTVSLSALCEGSLRAARLGEEGTAWVVQNADSDDVTAAAQHNYLGRALWAALRREHRSQFMLKQQAKTE